MIDGNREGDLAITPIELLIGWEDLLHTCWKRSRSLINVASANLKEVMCACSLWLQGAHASAASVWLPAWLCLCNYSCCISNIFCVCFFFFKKWRKKLRWDSFILQTRLTSWKISIYWRCHVIWQEDRLQLNSITVFQTDQRSINMMETSVLTGFTFSHNSNSLLTYMKNQYHKINQ